ncbi:MAG TPA: HpcH/HpaI aldolase/citrate lyase family protein [Burkholderiales bacterium]|nr:HpcH/HpaI aldolase/citrate lyase family protein [Burkholderiales bacterium]
MDMPINHLKRALRAGRTQTGCWLSLASHVSAEICASAGFDWVLVDTEHAPADLQNVHHQLHAIAAYPTAALVRAYWNDTVLIKRLLDVGVQSLLLPYVQNAEEAKRAVAAVRYPPQGVRGVSANSRANRFGRVPDYFAQANDNILLLLQIETRAAVAEIEKMAAIDGVDGLFIGPQDLAADFGHLGNPGHPDVQAAMADALTRIGKTGKVPGILAFNEADAKRWIAHGARFVAVTSDQFLLVRESAAVAARFRTS